MIGTGRQCLIRRSWWQLSSKPRHTVDKTFSSRAHGFHRTARWARKAMAVGPCQLLLGSHNRPLSLLKVSVYQRGNRGSISCCTLPKEVKIPTEAGHAGTHLNPRQKQADHWELYPTRPTQWDPAICLFVYLRKRCPLSISNLTDGS